jgi:putative chitinase
MITKLQLIMCMPNATLVNIDRFLLPLNSTMERFNINTPTRIAMFLAQLAHESGSLRYVKEIASGEAYEWRKSLGNIFPGDGKKYKGRGLIQLTGRANYQRFKDTFDVDVVTNPELLEQPIYAALSAGWFWNKAGLNIIADRGDEEAFKKVTKRINGGYNGLIDRQHHWERCKKELGI